MAVTAKSSLSGSSGQAGRGLIPVEFVHRLDVVARDDELGHLHRVAIERGAAQADDLHDRHGGRDPNCPGSR